MSQDARFEDGIERALRLKADDADDLQVIAALLQDAITPGDEMTWRKSERRFAMLVNRYRWEDRRSAERVQSVLAIEDVQKVATQGVSPKDSETILSLLTITFEPSEDGMGQLMLTFAGDGALAINVEALNVTLQDVTRPYVAPSGKSPSHPD